MKKEIYLAILIGLLGGALTAIFTVFLPTLLKNIPQNPTHREIAVNNTPSISPTPYINNNTLITVDSLSDGEILSENKINLSGKTEENSLVVLETDDSIETYEASQDGKFTFAVTLIPGANIFKLLSYLPNRIPYEKKLNVFYTSEKL